MSGPAREGDRQVSGADPGELSLSLALWAFALQPTVHYSHVRQDEYTIRVGSTSGPEVGNAERIRPPEVEGPLPGMRSTLGASPWLRFTPREETRELFRETPMQCRTLPALKVAIHAELLERSLELAARFLREADEEPSQEKAAVLRWVAKWLERPLQLVQNPDEVLLAHSWRTTRHIRAIWTSFRSPARLPGRISW